MFSGATSVGQYTIQLARIASYRVVTTTSPKNFELVKALGADAIFDYRDQDIVEKIKEVTGDTLEAGLDTIVEEKTQEICVKAFGKKGGKLVVIQGPRKSVVGLRKDVQVQFEWLVTDQCPSAWLTVMFIVTLIYTCLGKSFSYPWMDYPASEADRLQMVVWMPKITELVRLFVSSILSFASSSMWKRREVLRTCL